MSETITILHESRQSLIEKGNLNRTKIAQNNNRKNRTTFKKSHKISRTSGETHERAVKLANNSRTSGEKPQTIIHEKKPRKNVDFWAKQSSMEKLGNHAPVRATRGEGEHNLALQHILS